MTGARVVGSLSPTGQLLRKFTAGGTFAEGDFVKLQGTTGEIVIATGGDAILGVAMEAGVDGSEAYVNITPKMLVIMDNDLDSDTFAATDELQFADIIGATGAQQVDTSSHSATVAQLMCLGYNPKGYGLDSDTSIGLYLVTERTTGY